MTAFNPVEAQKVLAIDATGYPAFRSCQEQLRLCLDQNDQLREINASNVRNMGETITGLDIQVAQLTDRNRVLAEALEKSEASAKLLRSALSDARPFVENYYDYQHPNGNEKAMQSMEAASDDRV